MVADEAVAAEDKKLVVVTQRDASVDERTVNDIFNVGTVAVLKKASRTDGSLQLIVHGVECVALEQQVEPDQPTPHELTFRVAESYGVHLDTTESC